MSILAGKFAPRIHFSPCPVSPPLICIRLQDLYNHVVLEQVRFAALTVPGRAVQ